MATLGERLKEERERIGLTQIAFASLAGKKKHSQIRYEAGTRSPDSDYLLAIAEHGVDILYVLTGEREADAIQRAARELDPVQPLIDKIRDDESTVFQQAIEATKEFWKGLDPSNYVLVPLSKATLSAGAGASNPSEAIVDHLVFRQSWLRGLGVEPKHARLARVRGASMIPMIHDNDLVLIDTSKREVPVRTANPAKSILYALTQDGEARVKWVQRPDEKTLILHSENSALHPPEYYTGHDAAEVNVIGKVLWWGHSVRD